MTDPIADFMTRLRNAARAQHQDVRIPDSKLKRDVAIKVLPQSLAADADALARFEREALAVAALSHPNILSIFDFGTSSPTRSSRRRATIPARRSRSR